MVPVRQSITIARPQQEVYDYLLDIANHEEFSDHYLVDWHLTRVDSYGRGAGARFRVKLRRNRFGWADLTIAEAREPRLIVGSGRGGKFNRTRLLSVYELAPGPSGTTRVDYTVETEPATFSDRLMESLGVRGWFRRQSARSLRRLRAILEDGEQRGGHTTVAGL